MHTPQEPWEYRRPTPSKQITFLTVIEDPSKVNEQTMRLWKKLRTNGLLLKDLYKLKNLLNKQEVKDTNKISTVSREINKLVVSAVGKQIGIL